MGQVVVPVAMALGASAGTAATIGSVAGVGAGLATVGAAAYGVHGADMQKKEVNRQKSIAAEQMRIQGEEVAKQKTKADAEEKALQDEIIAKQRGQEALNSATSETTNKRRQRGRRSLIFGSETGINNPFEDVLG